MAIHSALRLFLIASQLHFSDSMFAVPVVTAPVSKVKARPKMRQLCDPSTKIRFPTMRFSLQTDRDEQQTPNDWINLGLSSVYLAHFASMYTQLPGLFGQSGILPIAERPVDIFDTWAIEILPFNPEVCLETFGALGIFLAAMQIVYRPLRSGSLGMTSFALLWVLWHDLVVAGGRFTSYQMDFLLLDAAPLAVLSASGLSPSAVTFGYRWLLSRLYLGAGAVKLLSCDRSWRDLSAVHWHFQSQPLPNALGAMAYKSIPNHPLGELLTLSVLVVEMAAPFLFLAPSKGIRRVAFGANVLLMAGIMSFGNFGPLQFLLIIIGIALLDGDDLISLSGQETDVKPVAISQNKNSSAGIDALVTALAVSLALWASVWSAYNVNATCGETWGPEPLVYGAIILAVAVSLSLCSGGGKQVVDAALGLILVGGSAVPLAQGLNVALPDAFAFIDSLTNIGATPYGLFAVMTGSDGTRPVVAISGSMSADGPWFNLPFKYQVNDPSAPLPLCFPHFPRLDWTLWFLPLGESGKQWLGRFLHGVTMGEDTVINLLDATSFHQIFPSPPEFIKLTPMSYTLDSDSGWQAVVNSEIPSRVAGVVSRGELPHALLFDGSAGDSSWPSLPVIRNAASSVKPEQFIWLCFFVTEVSRRALIPIEQQQDGIADQMEDY